MILKEKEIFFAISKAREDSNFECFLYHTWNIQGIPERAHHNKFRKVHASFSILLSSQERYLYSEKSTVGHLAYNYFPQL